jgi:hypothetical protein
MIEELATGATLCAERPVVRAKNPKVKGDRVRACVVAGKRYDSIKEGYEELRQLRRGISYWMLYRALRNGENHVQDISIELLSSTRGWMHSR